MKLVEPRATSAGTTRFRAVCWVRDRPEIEERCVFLVASDRDAAVRRLREGLAAHYRCLLEAIECYNLVDEHEAPDEVLDGVIGWQGSRPCAWATNALVLDGPGPRLPRQARPAGGLTTPDWRHFKGVRDTAIERHRAATLERARELLDAEAPSGERLEALAKWLAERERELGALVDPLSRSRAPMQLGMLHAAGLVDDAALAGFGEALRSETLRFVRRRDGTVHE